MFWIYLRRELRRRLRQAVFIALGLALGIGLVITVTSAATGVRNAQSAATGALALTDITVTGTVPALTAGSGTFSSSFTTNTFSVDGVDVARRSPGPLGSATVTAGRDLGSADATADVALADSSYATANKLKTGSTVTIGNTNFKVVGIVSVPQGSSPPDRYIPLAKARQIGVTGTAKLTSAVNTIYVSADSASDIPAVQRGLTRLLSTATVTDAGDLASQVTGSVNNAASLADNLGKWLSVAVLVAAFGLAILLTMAAVACRVREFGTLKALGWRSGRIVGQVMGESLAIGVIGGAAGVALGYGGAALIDKLAPKLSAVEGPGSGSTVVSGITGKLAQQLSSATTHTVYVTLTAPVTLGAIGLAVVLAVAGGLLAGAFGGWRAARLRPAAALAKVG